MNQFIFNPPDGLLNKSYFPTNPATEEEARGQFQEPLNQIKNYINETVVPKVETLEQALLNPNGYQKLPSGLEIKWGVVSNLATGNSSTVTFPTTFSNNCFGVWCQGAYGQSNIYDLTTANLTKSGVTIYKRSSQGGTSTDDVRWVALGY